MHLGNKNRMHLPVLVPLVRCYSEGEVPFTTLSGAYFSARCLSTDAREVNCAFDGKCVSIAAAGMRTPSREDWTARCTGLERFRTTS